ncbi:hypothetical protein F7018_03720 [Tenacibaculum aiptasiae]|uniref:DUF3299 domain-containing protein n=1 Tax=Tenacibaculum aiptasiae TaxID=426481 RepID=A0A7J5APA5_9FLAO|nr:hypothetical protein [Tenacibaculum aiptasiae]KAB1159429.1 hypothetical protein F7018_03720 [Tenacibaculum aiptasiae]
MKNKVLFIVFLSIVSLCFSQQKVTWNDLSKVKFRDKYFPEHDETFLHPTFSESVKSLNGRSIAITGYFLNVDPKGRIFVLSKGPMSSCFFCGVGGPETAIELHVVGKRNFRTDATVTARGILKLNSNDVEHFNYILTECRIELYNKK